MFQVAICDDLPQELLKIETAIHSYLKVHTHLQMEITCFHNPLLFLEKITQSGGYDIALLDICMPGINGTDVAKEIRRRKDKTEIIFITNSDEFAIAAFSLKAAHYLLKPFLQEEFDEAMDRAVAAFTSNVSPKITLKISGSGMRTIEVNEILYIESSGHIQNIYLANEVLEESRRSLSRLAEELEKLSPGQFLSPCKGYLVNLAAVQAVERDFMRVSCGKKVPIVRRRFRELSNKCFEYSFLKIRKQRNCYDDT